MGVASFFFEESYTRVIEKVNNLQGGTSFFIRLCACNLMQPEFTSTDRRDNFKEDREHALTGKLFELPFLRTEDKGTCE
jgi:hypothetical protein